MSGRRLNLDELLIPAGEVTLAGVVHVVLPLDGAGYQALQQMEGRDPKPEDVEPLYQAVARCVPSLTAEQVAHLRPHQVGAIVGLAMAPIEKVEAAIPKASRGARSRSPRPTRSATSSSG